ncbi:ABC transporter substrate-binding protein [Paracoccus seriniphilus]|uniref:Peptide/nickel transport system substrate-binding protein n=1 Tax=Paracoccus seriniphilus TaxID=184748 RepID=A0A239PNB5_9RHOB|nr:ABC transporter substrate-binding protein [Paracoccus seriniphilus]WCR13577.1 ABC transporter substrate-binding protein [Paracoccus seriniphilus]SNT68839.1 peptide/nickel transport system substrate-binding protein [Paracoccus seriniphilus]
MWDILKSSVAAVALLTGAAWGQDSITIGMVLEPPNLDPTGVAAAATDEVVYANLFEGLTRFGPDGSVRPALAASWDVEDDGRSYLFHLREGVTFHDGTAFDAEDVRFSLDRARAADSTNAQKQLFAGIEAVEIVDPLTVRVRLTRPDGNFPFKMAWGDAVMVSQDSIADIATAPVGTGPFRFERWVQGDRVELSAYDGYWGEKPALTRATFRFISDPTAAFAAMMAEDVDAFPNFPAPETLPQLQADPRFEVIVGTTEGETILAMNNSQPPLDDIRVRQAIAHAINRADIINGAMFGYGTPIGSHFAPHHPDYVDLAGLSAYDPELSRTLLAELDEAPRPLRLALPPPSYARRGGEIVASQLREVGIETEITNMEWAQWLETVFKGGDFDLTIVSHTEPLDIDIYARPDYYFHYDGARLAEVMAQLQTAVDPQERSALYQQAQRLIAEDYVNGFLFQLAKTGVANARLEGLWENAPTQANDLTGVRWVD